jgi:hypothetical protein
MTWAPISPWRPVSGTGQNLTIGSASVASTTFDSTVQAVLVSAIGGNCHVAVGTAPVAVGTDMLVKASDPPFLIRISPGEKIAAIQDQSSTGTLNLIPMTH